MRPDVPTSGWIEDGKHHLPLRVYYEDTDAGGIVYHAVYLQFAERGRSELLRLIGVGQEAVRRKDGQIWVIRRLSIDYKRPAKLDDHLVIVTHLTEIGAASATFQQSVMRDGREITRVIPQAILLDKAGKPTRIPQAMVDSLNIVFGIS